MIRGITWSHIRSVQSHSGPSDVCGPLYHKSVIGQELFCCFLKQTGSITTCMKIHKFIPLSIYFFLFITYNSRILYQLQLSSDYSSLFIPLLPGKLTNKFKNTRYTISSHSDVSKLFSVHKLPILISKHKKQHTKPGQFLLSKKIRDTISQQRFL